LRRQGEAVAEGEATGVLNLSAEDAEGSDRSRRIRDAVEAALSDIILLGTEEQVRLATRAARELIAGNPIHTHALVVSLRNFIREALDLAQLPPDLEIPGQGPARPLRSGGSGKSERGKDDSQKTGSGKGGMGLGSGMAMGGGMGFGLGTVEGDEDPLSPEHRK
jgi:hypothetical protein